MYSLRPYYQLLLLIFLWSASPNVSHAHEERTTQAKLLSHMEDSHVWHFATIDHRHISLYLPVILYKKEGGLYIFSSHNLWDAHHHPTSYQGFALTKDEKIVATDGNTVYDFSITKNVMAMLLSILLMLLLFIGLAHHTARHGTPRGKWILLTKPLMLIRNLAHDKIGQKHADTYLPYLLTLFFYIWFNNVLGLFPGGANLTGNISITLVLALSSSVMTNWHGNRHYWAHIFNPPGMPKWLLPILIPIELIGLVTKPIILMARLFVNILIGHIVLLTILGVIFMIKPIFALFTIVPLTLGVAMLFLKLFVCFFQAYIFTMFATLYLSAAVVEDKH
jgi:F-type H+-transporting ATPase subunit a